MALFLGATASSLRAQAPPPYTPLVWDENWSYLSDLSKALDWSDNLQHVNLFGSSYVSIGGQMRERGEYIDFPGWGAQPKHNGYLLQRYLLDSDWHLANSFRLFAQLGSSLEDGRTGGPRPGIDQNTLYFNQIFFDYSPSEALTVRVGRQLVSLGSTRLFAIGYGLNIEQPFDGVRITVHKRLWDVDLLALRPTQILNGFFQNEPNSQVEAWGVYGTRSLPSGRNLKLDLYYIGFDRKAWRYAQGSGHEQRETFGARLWNETPAGSWDWEFTGQTGRFGAGSIRAWATGFHMNHRFVQTRWTPQVELDGGVTSGDHDLRDGKLGTFNPLFPNGSYLSESQLIGPYNVRIVRPKLMLNLSRKLTFSPNLEFLWRQSTEDGIYNIVGVLTHPGGLSNARFVGSQIQTSLAYAFTRHLNGTVTYEHFWPGAFLKQTPPNHSVNFVGPQVAYTF